MKNRKYPTARDRCDFIDAMRDRDPATTGEDFDDTGCSKRTHYPRELEIFVIGFCSILMSHIQFRRVVKRSSAVEVERGIFDYYSVMRRTQSSDLLVFVHDRCDLRFSTVLS